MEKENKPILYKDEDGRLCMKVRRRALSDKEETK